MAPTPAIQARDEPLGHAKEQTHGLGIAAAVIFSFLGLWAIAYISVSVIKRATPHIYDKWLNLKFSIEKKCLPRRYQQARMKYWTSIPLGRARTQGLFGHKKRPVTYSLAMEKLKREAGEHTARSHIRDFAAMQRPRQLGSNHIHAPAAAFGNGANAPGAGTAEQGPVLTPAERINKAREGLRQAEMRAAALRRARVVRPTIPSRPDPVIYHTQCAYLYSPEEHLMCEQMRQQTIAINQWREHIANCHIYRIETPPPIMTTDQTYDKSDNGEDYWCSLDGGPAVR